MFYVWFSQSKKYQKLIMLTEVLTNQPLQSRKVVEFQHSSVFGMDEGELGLGIVLF